MGCINKQQSHAPTPHLSKTCNGKNACRWQIKAQVDQELSNSRWRSITYMTDRHCSCKMCTSDFLEQRRLQAATTLAPADMQWKPTHVCQQRKGTLMGWMNTWPAFWHCSSCKLFIACMCSLYTETSLCNQKGRRTSSNNDAHNPHVHTGSRCTHRHTLKAGHKSCQGLVHIYGAT